jgi:hypothetical protein
MFIAPIDGIREWIGHAPLGIKSPPLAEIETR